MDGEPCKQTAESDRIGKYFTAARNSPNAIIGIKGKERSCPLRNLDVSAHWPMLLLATAIVRIYVSSNPNEPR